MSVCEVYGRAHRNARTAKEKKNSQHLFSMSNRKNAERVFRQLKEEKKKKWKSKIKGKRENKHALAYRRPPFINISYVFRIFLKTIFSL